MLGSVYATVAVALTLSIGVLNFLNFSIPGLFMIGGMTTWALISQGVPWPLAAVGALFVVAICSLLVERFTWRRWMRGAEPFVPLVSSMAFLILFEHLAIAYFGSDMRVVSGFAQSDLRIAGLVIAIPQLIGLVFCVGLIFALSLLLKKTRLGRGLRTIAEDSNTALL